MPGATVQLLGEKHFSGVGPEPGAAHPAQTVLFATNHEPVKKVAMWLPATEFAARPDRGTLLDTSELWDRLLQTDRDPGR